MSLLGQFNEYLCSILAVKTYLLKDNGNYQVLALPKAINVMENIQIEIEVLDQYNGTKYDDIVISKIKGHTIKM